MRVKDEVDDSLGKKPRKTGRMGTLSLAGHKIL